MGVSDDSPQVSCWQNLGLGNPARRALEHAGITSVEKLAAYSEKEILALHGLGPASLPKLRQGLAEVGLAFKK